MTCCDTPKNLRLYRADTPTGQAACCVKCGRAHAASKQEIDRILTEGSADE